jgi:hypothetical protein
MFERRAARSRLQPDGRQRLLVVGACAAQVCMPSMPTAARRHLDLEHSRGGGHLLLPVTEISPDRPCNTSRPGSVPRPGVSAVLGPGAPDRGAELPQLGVGHDEVDQAAVLRSGGAWDAQ